MGGVPAPIIAVLMLFATRAVVHPLKRTSAKLREIALGGGDLTERLEAPSGDEIGELSTGAQEVLSATSALSEITVKVQDGSDEMQRGAREVLGSVESVRDAGNRVDRSIKHIAERGESIRQLVTEVGALSRRVGHAMQGIQEGMDSFRTSAADSAEGFAPETEDELLMKDE
jgi:methyl-accepting chemotaxis protein